MKMMKILQCDCWHHVAALQVTQHSSTLWVWNQCAVDHDHSEPTPGPQHCSPVVPNCWLEFQDQHDVKINSLTFYHDESTTHWIELCVLKLCVWQNSYKAVTQSEQVQDQLLALEPPVNKRCARCSWSWQQSTTRCYNWVAWKIPCSVFSLLTGWLFLGHVTGWYSSVKYMQ